MEHTSQADVLEISEHAILRAKERLSWSLNTLKRMAEKALATGLQHNELTGKLRRYADDKGRMHKGKARIYGEVLYGFHGNKLTTVYLIPRKLRKYLIKHMDKRKTTYTEEELAKWYEVSCPKCGWEGLSRDAAGGNPIADTGDYTDPECPHCRHTPLEDK